MSNLTSFVLLLPRELPVCREQGKLINLFLFLQISLGVKDEFRVEAACETMRARQALNFFISFSSFNFQILLGIKADEFCVVAAS